MASVNRYTNIQPGQYNPRTLQELMVAPSYKRGQHDLLDERRGELETELAQSNSLGIHSDMLQQEQQKLQEQMSAQADRLSSEGFNSTSKSDFLNLNKQYQQSISPTGTIGKIGAAEEAMNTEKETYMTNATKEGYGSTAAEDNWQQHISTYAKEFDKSGKISNIGSLYAPKYHDVVSEAKALFKSAGFDENTLYNDLGTSNIVQNKEGNYVVTTKGYKKYGSNVERLESALDYMNNQINNTNSEVYQSLIHQGKTPESAMQEIEGLGEVFIKTKSDQAHGETISNYSPAKEAGIMNTGNSSYDTTSATNVKRFNSELDTTLSNIIEGKMATIYGSKYRASEVAPPNSKREKSTFENSLKGKEKENYDALYNQLKDDNPVLLTSDKYSPEAAVEIQAYLKDTADVLRQNFIIQDDFVKEYGTSTGVTKSKADIDKYIKTNLSDQTFGYNGEEYTYSELPEDIKKNIMTAKYSGFLSPKNFEGFQKESNENLYVSPHVYELYDEDTGDIEKLYVGRKAGERNTPEFKADKIFNKVYQTAKFRPKIAHKIKGLKATVKYMPSQDMYILTDNATGEKQAMDEITLQNAIYTASGAK